MSSKKWLLALAVAGSISAVTACSAPAGEGGNSASTQQEAPAPSGAASEGANPEAQEMPKPDTEGVPDVVAEVNGEKIAKKDFVAAYEGQFQQMAMQSQMSGQKLDQDKLKDQTVEGMISSVLLTQEADNRGLEAPKKEVDATLDELVKSSQLKSKDEFLAAMKDQGMDEKTVMSEIEKQVRVEALVAEESGDTKPTEEELKKAYDQAKAQQEQMKQQGGQGGQGAEIPPFEEAKPALEEQLKGQKQGEAAQALVKDLRADADVKIHL